MSKASIGSRPLPFPVTSSPHSLRESLSEFGDSPEKSSGTQTSHLFTDSMLSEVELGVEPESLIGIYLFDLKITQAARDQSGELEWPRPCVSFLLGWRAFFGNLHRS